MTDISKKVNRIIPSLERSQTFDDGECSTGDILLIEESLGRPASHLLINADDPMSFRLNVYQKVFPMRKLEEGWNFEDGSPNLSLEQQVKVDTAIVELGASESFELDNELIIKDLELVTVSGTFDIFVS